jgi:hypothetical protein
MYNIIGRIPGGIDLKLADPTPPDSLDEQRAQDVVEHFKAFTELEMSTPCMLSV